MKAKRPIILSSDAAFVSLTKGKRAIIDSSDVPLVEGHNWQAQRWSDSLWYAVTRYGILMHRLLLQPPDELETDHVNHNGLDNRRANLRACTHSQNMANGRQTAIGTSRFRGVSRDKQCSKWRVQITNKRVNLGRFDSEVEAARAYDNAALELYGEFASPNFPRTREKVTA